MPTLTLAATAVNLGTAGNFVILAKTGISTTGSTSVIGDIGVSPAAASYITGFGLTLPSASAYSTSALVTGKVYAPDYADPTPANLTTAVLDMQTAYTDAAGRAPTVTELGAGNIGGLTLTPGVYKWGTGLTIPTDVTLFGSADDVWIFQVAQNLDISSAKKIVLAGGAQANNIFWVVAGQTTIGTTAVFNGNILDQAAIVLNTGARLNGRALAQTAVTLDASAVTMPTSAAPIPEPTPSPEPISSDLTTYGVTQTSIAGDLVKLADSKTVYLVNDGERSAFPNQKIYSSWYGNDFSAVKTISASQLASYTLTANVVYKPGTVLKVPSVPKVYLVTDNGVLRWITNEDTFYAMGFSFSQVQDLPESFFPNYQSGTDI